MSHFITIISENNNTKEPVVSSYNERAIHCVHLNKDASNPTFDVVQVVLIDECAPLDDRLYSIYINRRKDAEYLLVSQMGFNRKLFDALVFKFDGSLVKELAQ